MKYFLILKNIFALAMLCWIAGFIWFIKEIPNQTSNFKTETDAIIVLTGGSGRVEAGFFLLSNKISKALLISGVGKNTRLEDLSISSNKLYDKDLENKITLGYVADSTVGNAKEAKLWMQKNSYNTMTLVTSNYHMPRSIAEFKEEMPNYKIIPYAVIPEHVKINKWWAFPGTLKLVLLEYNKYLLHNFH